MAAVIGEIAIAATDENPSAIGKSDELTELKTKSTQELIDMAAEMGIENMARSRKQDIIFSLLKKHAKSGEDIFGDGVLEILSDGFGFLRSADSSFLAGPTISMSVRAKSDDSI